MNKSFKHSGDLGDIIYSLPVIKLMGGGDLFLDITGGEDEEICKRQCMDGKTKFNKRGFDFIKPLIEIQPYISSVQIYKKGQHIDYNLNNFRYKFAVPNSINKYKNLLDFHLDAFGLPEWDPNEGWLTVPNPVELSRKTVVSRSPRMQASYTWFEHNKFNLRDKAIFIGLPKEHELFEFTFDIKIPFHLPSPDNALEVARVIAGSKAFIVNSTFNLAVGIGLGTVPIVQEVYTKIPLVKFPGKKNMQYI